MGQLIWICSKSSPLSLSSFLGSWQWYKTKFIQSWAWHQIQMSWPNVIYSSPDLALLSIELQCMYIVCRYVYTLLVQVLAHQWRTHTEQRIALTLTLAPVLVSQAIVSLSSKLELPILSYITWGYEYTFHSVKIKCQIFFA